MLYNESIAWNLVTGMNPREPHRPPDQRDPWLRLGKCSTG
jgi:hypothetical protein